MEGLQSIKIGFIFRGHGSVRNCQSTLSKARHRLKPIDGVYAYTGYKLQLSEHTEQRPQMTRFHSLKVTSEFISLMHSVPTCVTRFHSLHVTDDFLL